MIKIKKMLIIFLSIMTVMLVGSNAVIATSIEEVRIEDVEYTEEYQNWLTLSDEEKSQVLAPKMYEIQTNQNTYLKSMNNPLKINTLLKSANLTRYSLKDVIPDNVVVKNQEETNFCWAFATLGALETNLALQDYNASKKTQVYDFSERHMVYASSKNSFLDNKINEKGFNLRVSQGGNYHHAEAYLTNGSGAIAEREMPYENNEDNIDIASIQNKNVVTTLYDTAEFSYVDEMDKETLISNMKSHISIYGGLYAGVYGADLMDSKYYNNKTGALYVDDTKAKINHAVLIIGWDDEYDKNNFVEEHRPTNNGAWKVKNSWGEKFEITLEDAKKQNFEANKEKYQQQGYPNYQSLPDDVFVELFVNNGYTPNADNTVFTFIVGDDGYMYVSYEDVNVYENLWGIRKAVNEKDYLNIYQNDILGASRLAQLFYKSGSIYVANVFKRDKNTTEALNRISLETYQNWKDCKVYVNPTGSDKAKENLIEMKLKEGSISENDIDIVPGYHTIEFATPIELTGDSFAVVVEFKTDEYPVIPIEAVNSNGWENAVVNANESFYTISGSMEKNEWQDLALSENEKLRGNVIVKAFTERRSANLTSLSVTKQPNKTTYKAGENFESAGMEITATYSDNSQKLVNNYKIENGTNLQTNQNSVVISYTENYITQKTTLPITVTANQTESSENKAPKSSDFTDTRAHITGVRFNSDTGTARLSIAVSNIKIGDEADKYTYSYCLLNSTEASQIKDEDWNSVPEDSLQRQTDGSYTILLDIDLNQLNNRDTLLGADKIYLYLKEIVELNGQRLETIKALDIELENDGMSQNEVQIPNEQKSNSSNDDTVANRILPNTGNVRIMIIILGVVGIGIFSYYKYRNIDR